MDHLHMSILHIYVPLRWNSTFEFAFIFPRDLALSMNSLNSGLSQLWSSSRKLLLGRSSCSKADVAEAEVEEGRLRQWAWLAVIEIEGVLGEEERCKDDGGDSILLGETRVRLVQARFIELEWEMDVGPGFESTSSSQEPLPSSTSSSFASLMTTISRLRAFLPSSMSIESLSLIQSIYHREMSRMCITEIRKQKCNEPEPPHHRHSVRPPVRRT